VTTHLLITDSGVGGLSVCAYAERFLRTHHLAEPVRLTYVNASPENDFGYNSMGSRQEKLEHFDRFLHIIDDRYAPDELYIACNTLSVLLPETSFAMRGRPPVRGIVETGVRRLREELGSEDVVAIFGTPTTIDEGTYAGILQAGGVDAARIISQACPGLADTISEDRRGDAAGAEISRFVRAVVDRLPSSAGGLLVYLACTHYGYRKELFASAFRDAGLEPRVLDPNALAVDDLFGSAPDRGPDEPEVEVPVEVVSRYRIPPTAIETISFFLEEISPRTVRAFCGFTHAPGLF